MAGNKLIFTALAGSSFAGKSTLIADLVHLNEELDRTQVATIAEYCAENGGNLNFRRIPFSSQTDAEANIDDFIGWEKQRQQLACRQRHNRPIIMDRTIFCFLLTQLMLAKFRPDWFNTYDYGIETVAKDLAGGRLILPQRLILLEPADEATFLSRTSRGVSVSFFNEPKIWRFFSRSYRLIIEQLYGEGNNLILYSNNSPESRADLAHRAKDFLISNQPVAIATVEDFKKLFSELRSLTDD